MTADEIPPRPATGIGAPAVPSSTSSVAMLASPVPEPEPVIRLHDLSRLRTEEVLLAQFSRVG
jgi:hypothetical protein